MTISSTDSEISYATDGVTAAFAIPFPFDTASDIRVFSVSTSTVGSPTELTTGFTITGGSGSTGTCTFSPVLASGFKITIIDDPDQTQTHDYTDNDPFPAQSHEQALDRLTRLIKRLSKRLGRAIRFPDGVTFTEDDTQLSPLSNWLNKFLYFGSDGKPTPATISSQVMTQEIIGSLLYPITAAEQAAGVTPVNYYLFPGNILRYGTNTIPGTTDMSVARQAAHNQFAAGGAPVYVPAGTYRCDTNLAVAATTAGAPCHIYGDGMRASVFTSALDIEQVSVTGADATHSLTCLYIHDVGFSSLFPIAANNTGPTKFHLHLTNSLQARIQRVYFSTLLGDVTSGTDAGIPNNHAGVWFDVAGGFGAAYLNEVTDCWLNHAQVNMGTSDSIISRNIAWMPTGDYTFKVDQPNISVYDTFDLVVGKAHGGIWLTTNATNCKVRGNFFDGGGASLLSSIGIWADTQVSNSIDGNIFWNLGGSGVWLTNPSIWSVCNNIFLNCGRNDTGVDLSDIVLNAISFASNNNIINNLHYKTDTRSGGAVAAVYERNGGANPTNNRIGFSQILDTASQYQTPGIKLASGSTTVLIGCYGKSTETEGVTQFVLTLTGCTTSPTVTATFVRSQKLGVLYIPQVTGTSNSTAATLTGLPAALIPFSNQLMSCIVEDNGAFKDGSIQVISSTGVINLFTNNLGAFTAGGVKGIGAGITIPFQIV